MSKRQGRSLVAILAAVLTAVLGVTSAFAATTWTVRPGGPVSMKSGKFVLTDTTTGSALACPSSALTGTLTGGSGLPGSGIGSITAAGFRHCSSPFGFGFVIKASDLPWQLNVSSYSATAGVVTGSLSHLQLKLLLPSCTAVIDGTSGTASDGIVNFRYANSMGALKPVATGGNLHIYKVRGCAGLISTGDSATIGATYTVTPKQTITSP